MAIDLNTAPYYDDFSEGKNFHQIVFKPGYAVQARELTQLQSILRDQIRKFGNHIFQHGSVVIPGNSFADLSTPFIKLQATYNSAVVNVTQFEDKVIVGDTSGIKAIVRKAVAATDTDPPTLYLAYLTGGGETGTTNFFSNGEEIYVEEDTSIRALLLASSATGTGSLVHLNTGVFYIRGNFVYTDKQVAVIDKYANSPNCHVLLQISESVVDSADDDSLLDPALGSTNYSAPGADRYKISLTLTSLPLNETVGEDYVEIMRFEEGVLKENNQYPKYSELEKSLARRTFDESGDYLVYGFRPTVREHKKTLYNSGVFESGNIDKFVVEISPGKAYIRGFETEVISPSRIELDRARTSAHTKQKEVSIKNEYGSYLYVSNLRSLPNFRTNETVTLYNTSNVSDSTANIVGNVMVSAIDYFAGDPTTSSAIYKLYYKDVQLTGTYKLADIGGYRFGASGSGTVLHRHTVQNASNIFSVGEVVRDIGNTRKGIVARFDRNTGYMFVHKNLKANALPIVNDNVEGVTTGAAGTVRAVQSSVVPYAAPEPLFLVPASPLAALTDETNNYDAAYTVWKTFTISTDGSGNGTYTITDGTFASPEAGVTVAMGPGGVVDVSLLSLTSPTTMAITGGPTSVSVVICTQVNKTSVQPKVKTLNNGTLSSVTPAKLISLGKADVFKITSIISGTEDVTSRYVLDNGQTDYYYGISKIRLNGVLPTSNLTINFQYFTHSGAGDFFSIDSYQTLGADYIARVPNFRSPITSKIYSLKDYLDFRPRIGDNGTFSAGSASLCDQPVVDTFFMTSAKYYVPRVDMFYVTQNKSVEVAQGIPNEYPITPDVPSNAVQLFSIYVPSYTASVTSIFVNYPRNVRFTMKDINKLQEQIQRVEYFSTLSAIENSLLTYEVVDAVTGLNRFKTGYLVDNFDNPFTVCDYFNQFNRSHFTKRRLSAGVESHDAPLELKTDSANYQVTGKYVTLPYTEVPFVEQNTSTRITNLNPFLVFAWEGVMTIQPPADSWVETESLATIYRSVTNTIVVRREERVEVPFFVDTPRDRPAPAVPRIFNPPPAVVEVIPEVRIWQEDPPRVVPPIPPRPPTVVEPPILNVVPPVPVNPPHPPWIWEPPPVVAPFVVDPFEWPPVDPDPPSTCPAPWMRILLADGSLIEAGDLKPGMMVQTKHEDTLKEGNFKVEAVSIVSGPRLKVIFNDLEFVGSTTHKFYKDGEWVEIKDLKVGDVIDGHTVESIEDFGDGEVVRITIEEAHTYMVEGLLSHNKSPPPPPELPPDDPPPGPGELLPPTGGGGGGVVYIPVTAWSRDIGLPDDANFDGSPDIITFNVAEATYNASFNTLNSWFKDVAEFNPVGQDMFTNQNWINTIGLMNQWADEAGIDRGAPGTVVASQITDFWQNGGSRETFTPFGGAQDNAYNNQA